MVTNLCWTAVFLLLSCVHPAIISRNGRDTVTGDLEIRNGSLINVDLFAQVDALQQSDCRVSACNGHGNCSFNPTFACVCDAGYCGATCEAPNLKPVVLVSSVRNTPTTGQLTYAGNQCTTLSTSDILYLVKGTCAKPKNVMRTVTAPTLDSSGYATFGFSLSGLFQPFVACYKFGSSSANFTLTDTPSALACTVSTEYVCPATGLCVADCGSCSTYNLEYSNSLRICMRNLTTTYGTTDVSTAMSCGSCTSAPKCFNGITTDYCNCAAEGECAIWLTLNADYVIQRFNVYTVSGFDQRGENYQLMFFNSTSPPLISDNYAALLAKATFVRADYDVIINGDAKSLHDFSDSLPVARTVVYYRTPIAYKNLMVAEVRLYGYPYD